MGIEPNNIRISLDNNSLMKVPPNTKLGSIKGFEDGAILLVAPVKNENPPSMPKQEVQKNQTSAVPEKLTSKCDHGPNGKCLKCMGDSKPQSNVPKPQANPTTVEDKNKMAIEAPAQLPTSKCNHGPNGRCLNCINSTDANNENKEKYINTTQITKNCTHGPNGKCLNCMNRDTTDIKHLSFDEYIDKNFAKCKSHSSNSKCQNCLVDLAIDYKIKKDCKNHEPYPRGMCSKCMPPSINVKRQPYRHVDYAQFMNSSELAKFIRSWLE